MSNNVFLRLFKGCAGDEDHSRGHTCTGRNAEDCLEWDISADTSWDTPGSGIVACKSSGGVYTTDHMFLGYDDRCEILFAHCSIEIYYFVLPSIFISPLYPLPMT